MRSEPDLIMAKTNQPEAMTPVLHAIADTLARGHNVWLVWNIHRALEGCATRLKSAATRAF